MTDFAELAHRYLILIEGGPPSNYSAWSPDLPGCAATGDTLEDVEHEMREAQNPEARHADADAHRTTRTGRPEYCTTCLDTEPSSRRANFERPRSPTTMRSTPWRSAS